MRHFVPVLILFLAGLAKAEPAQWFPVNMGRGCVPMSDLYLGYVELMGKKTPSEFVEVLKKDSKNVKLQPFVDLYDSELYRKEHPHGTTTAAEDAVRKLFTRSNAVMITWSRKGEDDGLLFYDEELCKSLYGKLPQ